MALIRISAAMFCLQICLAFGVSYSEDGAATFDLDVSYITASPLGVPQQVCSLSLCSVTHTQCSLRNI